MKDNEQIYSYMRILDDEKYIVICNLSDENAEYNYDGAVLDFNNLILSNYNIDKHGQIKDFILNPWECRLYKIKN